MITRRSATAVLISGQVNRSKRHSPGRTGDCSYDIVLLPCADASCPRSGWRCYTAAGGWARTGVTPGAGSRLYRRLRRGRAGRVETVILRQYPGHGLVICREYDGIALEGGDRDQAGPAAAEACRP